MQNAKRAESMSGHAFSQFELTSKLLRNLYNYDLTPATKLVLLELTTHMNESKNGSVVFPSVGYIAEVLGIGLTATKKAINDLIKEGIVIKSKRNNVRGNYNKYLLRTARFDFNTDKNENEGKYTQPNIKGQKTANKQSENDFLKQPKSDLFFIRTNKNEQIEQQTVFIKGGNVYSGDDAILRDYAVKHGAKNVHAYINALKTSGSAAKIIKEHNKKRLIEQRAENSYKESQAWLRQQAIENALPECTAESCGCSLQDIIKKIRG